MAILKIHHLIILIFFLLALHCSCQLQTDTITSNSSIKDPNFIISRGNVFKFGFFSPENTTNRYLGVVYVVSDRTSAWIANRDRPLLDSSGVVTISGDGNLVLMNGQNETVWSTNATTSPLNTTAQIQDNGNLVLRDVSSGRLVWECFMHPTDVFLPTMRVMDNTQTGETVFLSAWKNSTDPAVGTFTTGIDFREIPQLVTWNNGVPHWRSGPWNGQTLIGMLQDLENLYTNVFEVTNDSGVYYGTVPSQGDTLMRVTLDTMGRIVQMFWDNRINNWFTAGYVPGHVCDLYGYCGPFGSCNRDSRPLCSCLRGFEPRDRTEWERGNWSGGCVRRTELECRQGNNTGNQDGFLRLRYMKVPDFVNRFPSGRQEDCETICLRNCSCIAHSFDPNIGCMFWGGTLIDIQQFPGLGPDLHIRLASSELENNKDKKFIIIIPVIAGIISLSIFIFITWWLKEKRRGGNARGEKSFDGEQRDSLDSTSIILIDESEEVDIKELPLFSFEVLAKATNQFHDDRLRGKGGFGHVYKGNLTNGKEIAVKRLSAASGQGRKEFMNEAMVISKLQHRNLVRLIGCCVEREEKILVYEYMPNKSLDMCLFDPSKRSNYILDWTKRFYIIEGIGRGLLYLHKDSMLRIIHRDLKPSNVLLDANWSPKISDFGMARIFGGNQEHGDTSRIVGTYGYMAPEYAVEGRFSEKSDVYSFGVLMLEIISGRKNTNYYNHELSLALLGYAWKLWNEEQSLAFVDPTIATNSECEEEMVRCIHIALLCVQEFPKDRPDIQTILSMLSYEIVDLDMPQEPIFAQKWNRFQVGSTNPYSLNGHSTNELTVTVLDGR